MAFDFGDTNDNKKYLKTLFAILGNGSIPPLKWGAGVAYSEGDLVTHGWNIYAAIQPSTGETPVFPSTAYWRWIWSLDVTVSTDDPSGEPIDGAIWIKREV